MGGPAVLRQGDGRMATSNIQRNRGVRSSAQLLYLSVDSQAVPA